MGTVDQEFRQLAASFERADELAADAARAGSRAVRNRLLGQATTEVASNRPVRVSVAARVLGLSETTVRAWVRAGVLTPVTGTRSRVVLDPARLHQVAAALTQVRAAGRDAGLLDEVYRRLVDATWADRDDLTVSLCQLRDGNGVVRVPKSP